MRDAFARNAPRETVGVRGRPTHEIQVSLLFREPRLHRRLGRALAPARAAPADATGSEANGAEPQNP